MSHTALANHTRAHALVQTLARLGLERAIVCPGSRSTPIVLALANTPEIATDVVLDERAAAFIALGAARTSGRAVALVCTSGSAAGHFLPAVMEAAESRVPLLLLTADRPPELHACGAPQTTPQHHLFGSHARWSFDLGTPSAHAPHTRWLPTLLARAWMLAHQAPAGPVHLNLPFRKPLWTHGGELQARSSDLRPAPMLLPGTPRLSNPSLSLVAQRLAQASRGVLLCGPTDPAALGGLEGRRAYIAALGTLAERLGWPLIAEPASQLRYTPHPLPGGIAHADALLRGPIARELSPDVVLRFGAAPTSKAIGAWLEQLPSEADVVVVDDAPMPRDPQHRMTTFAHHNPTDFCARIAQHLPATPPPSPWLEHWLALERCTQQTVQASLDSGVLWEGVLAHELVRALPPNAILHVGSSMPIRDLEVFGGCRSQDIPVLFNRGLNGIDGLIATACGEALATGRRVVLWLGDLSALHDLDGLASAIELGVDLTLVITQNGGGGIFENLPIAHHETAFERFFLTPQRASIGAISQALGASHHLVHERAHLAESLSQAIHTPGLSVVEAVVPRRENVERHRALWSTLHARISP